MRPPAIAALLARERLPELGPGLPDTEAGSQLRALGVAELFAPATIHDGAMAQAVRAGLWLYFDFLDASHVVSQDLDSVEGSYWHGIMHRREPDAANAAYWFRRVGTHAIFPPLVQDARRLGFESGSAWDPFEFIRKCAEQRGTNSAQEQLLCHVQRREMQLLLDWCCDKAAS